MAEIRTHPLMVIIQEDEVLVEYSDQSRMVDVNPQDKQSKVDYFIMGETREGKRLPSQAVLLPNPPKLMAAAKIHAARMSTSIRGEPASSGEASQAQFYFSRGKLLADNVMEEFTEAILQKRVEGIDLPEAKLSPSREMKMIMTYRNGKNEKQKANVYVQMKDYSNDAFQWQITGFKFEREGADIHIDTPDRIQPIEPQLMEWYTTSIASFKEFQNYLKKLIEARKKPPQGMY